MYVLELYGSEDRGAPAYPGAADPLHFGMNTNCTRRQTSLTVAALRKWRRVARDQSRTAANAATGRTEKTSAIRSAPSVCTCSSPSSTLRHLFALSAGS